MNGRAAKRLRRAVATLYGGRVTVQQVNGEASPARRAYQQTKRRRRELSSRERGLLAPTLGGVHG